MSKPPANAEPDEAALQEWLIGAAQRGFEEGVLVDHSVEYEGPGNQTIVITMKFRHKTAKAS